MLSQATVVFSVLAGLVSALQPPDRSAEGLRIIFSETFPGAPGSPPNETNWNIVTGVHVNNEKQDYTTESKNMQVSGGNTFQIVPTKVSGDKWASGRIETKGSWEAPVGGMMQIEAAVRFGWNPKSNKRGIWPAFWTMGDSIRHGTPWPQCGELDIMEQLNGEPVAHGTAHCGVIPGGPCNEQTGITATTPIVDDAFHVWAVRIDRRNADWTQQVITWFRDGQQFHSITGARIGDQAVWSTLAHSPLYIIFNVAVGGTLPGDTDDSTMGGYGSMMEFGQVAVYST